MKTIIAALALLPMILATPVTAQGYTKCRTINGTIIVVSGYTCPPGTIYVGPGFH